MRQGEKTWAVDVDVDIDIDVLDGVREILFDIYGAWGNRVRRQFFGGGAVVVGPIILRI